jgi:hypothetical protein
MRFFYSNLIDGASVVITETSEVSTLPSSNVAHEFRSVPWRTGTSVALEAVVFDLGSAQAVTACIILDHTLTAGDSLIKIQGHTSDSWGAPDVNETLTWSADAISKVFSSASKRYWRFTFTKSASGESRDIGRIFLGTYYEIDEGPAYDGYDEEIRDLSRKQKTLGGQTYTEVLPQYCMLKTGFSHITTTALTNLKTYIAAVGESVAHFIQVSTASPFNEVFYVKLARATKPKAVVMDSTPSWDLDLEFEEQL